MIINDLINLLIQYCDEKYKNIRCEHVNEKCLNLRCYGNCKECLNQIHFPNNYQGKDIKVDYDCQKIISFYICDYLVKYASEMYYLLSSSNLINEINSLNILSIGCGDCPDIIAFEEYLKNSNINNINYLGIDANEQWTNVHNIIRNYYNKYLDKKFNTEFLYDSFLNYKFNDYKPNVIVIQYLFSYLYLHNMNFEIDQIVDKIKDYIHSMSLHNTLFILINDVNSINAGRDEWKNKFYEKLNLNNNSSINLYYFHYNGIKEGQKKGVCNYSSELIFKYPDNINTLEYEVRSECTSIQMVIKINKENYDY